MTTRQRAGALLALVSLGVCTTAWYGYTVLNDNAFNETGHELVEVPDRFVELIAEAPPEKPLRNRSLPQSVLLDEGKEGNRDARMTEQPAAPIASQARPLDREIASNAGVIGSPSERNAAGRSTLDEDLNSGISGLIGAKGTVSGSTSVGSSGLGVRGAGLGGGGIADGLGGLGAKGRGSGGSGYGTGSGSFGSAAFSGGNAAPTRQPQAALSFTPAPSLAPEPEGTEDYQDYGVNEVTLTETDHLSTFSIDVDTASYTITRSKLNSNQLPPESAVRVEEFVNYFDYAYGAPSWGGDAPFSVNMEAAPSPWTPNRHILRVGIQGKELREADRKPARLTFLVDVSGSMSARNKLPLAQQAMKELVENLGPQDSVAIATYAGRTARILAPTAATEQTAINHAIDMLRSGGGTNMDSGIQLAYDMASDAFVDGAENRVIILSDGDANVGSTSHTELLRTISQYAKRGITLSTIGFGRGNYKDTLMEQLANDGDGNYFYIDTYQEAQKVFNDDLSGTIQTIARDVKIQVDFNPETVMAYRLIGYENRDIADRDFRNDKVDAGEIGSGHQVTALYELVLREGAGRRQPLATVRLRAKPPGPDVAAEEWSTAFPAKDVRLEFADTTRSFRLAVGAATFAEKLRGSPHVGEITYAEIREMIKDTREPGLMTLIGRAADLSGESATAALQ
ncbi:MAG: VWA domain-containing protein [Myxococcota bacterium]